MATSDEEIHVGDIGTVFELTLVDGGSPLPLEGAETTEFIFKPPNADAFTRTSTVVNPPGTNGKLEYTSVAGDLGEDFRDDAAAGDWFVQARAVLGAGAAQEGEWRSGRVPFVVHPNLKPLIPPP